MDRFSGFFSVPLFDKKYAEREVNAVNSEFDKNRLQDGWRSNHLVNQITEKGHPLRKFGIGNKDTLAGDNRAMSRSPAFGLLFLCVANSARSQMAEGLACARFGDQVSVQSAGSHPGTVNRHAVAVLAEIGVDIAGHRSKHVETIDPASVGTVIALCAEAVCPLFLGHARRLVWPLPDPAASGDTEEEELARFRAARDQIARHLDQLAF